MLNVQSERVDYRELLTPPPCYKVEFIVGTTYSLDLETLTAICAIIGLNIDADSELRESPLHLLEAIRKASGKLLIFCQGGRIAVPGKPNKLLPLLENCVVEVNLPNKCSFHPKTWFIKYTSKGLPDKFRIIIMSRNFTFDRSWDVALCLESAELGEETIEQSKDNGEALSSFITWLMKDSLPHNEQMRKKNRKLSLLSAEISNAEWKYLGKEFEGFRFIPYGIGYSSQDSLNEKFQNMFVISPFISKSIIEGYASKRLAHSDCTLITRKSELSKLTPELLEVFNTYTIKDDVVDGEERISDSGDIKTQDIHAKVYLRTRDSKSELYIGSANASYKAFYGGNVECLVLLWGKKSNLNVEKLKLDLFGSDEKSNPFERVEPRQYTILDEDADMKLLEDELRDFCMIKKEARITGKEPYTTTVTLEPFHADAKVFLRPLMKTREPKQSISERMVFPGFRLGELSEWYVVYAKSGKSEISRVIKINTSNIPSDRDSAIFSEIVKDKNEFLSYIAFLLSDNYLSTFLESVKSGKGDYRFLNMNFDTPILYERLLKAALYDPESLRDVRDVIALANDNIVPQDFLKLYEQFEKVVKP